MNCRGSGRSRTGSSGVQWTLSGSVASRSRSWSSKRIRAGGVGPGPEPLDEPRASRAGARRPAADAGRAGRAAARETRARRRPIAASTARTGDPGQGRPATATADPSRQPMPSPRPSAEAAGTASKRWSGTRNRSGSSVLRRLPEAAEAEQDQSATIDPPNVAARPARRCRPTTRPPGRRCPGSGGPGRPPVDALARGSNSWRNQAESVVMKQNAGGPDAPEPPERDQPEQVRGDGQHRRPERARPTSASPCRRAVVA